MANLDISSATFNADNSSLTLVFKQAGTTNPMYLAKDDTGAQLDGTQFQDNTKTEFTFDANSGTTTELTDANSDTLSSGNAIGDVTFTHNIGSNEITFSNLVAPTGAAGHKGVEKYTIQLQNIDLICMHHLN